MIVSNPNPPPEQQEIADALRPWFEDDTEDAAREVWQILEPVIAKARAEVIATVKAVRWHHLGDDDYAAGMEEAKRQILVALTTPTEGEQV